MNVVRINMSNGTKILNFFDLWPKQNKLAELNRFLRSISSEEIVIFATYDDGSVHLDESTRRKIAVLGSRQIMDLKFRDSWVFIGAKPTFSEISPNELRIKSSNAENIFGGWPAPANITGCIPKIRKN